MKCISTQTIKIQWECNMSLMESRAVIYIDGKRFSEYYPGRSTITKRLIKLATNDGFETVRDFFKWFNSDFEGKIIHWTEFNY